MDELTINITWQWALGIVGTLLVLAWYGSSRFTAIESSLNNIVEVLKPMKRNVNVMSNYLISKHKNFDSSELVTMSPFKLTDKGLDFIKEIGFDNVFNANKQVFFDCIEQEKPKLKYDVENSAIKSIYALSGNSYMDFLKVYFYNHPNRTMENTAPTLGVFLRDKYLEAHPEITQ